MTRNDEKILWSVIAVFGLCLVLLGNQHHSGLFAKDESLDDHTFIRKDYERTEFSVVMRMFDTREEFEATAKEEGFPDPTRVQAFSWVSTYRNECIIYIVKPEVDYKPEYLGHELTHCIYGMFHETRQSPGAGSWIIGDNPFSE